LTKEWMEVVNAEIPGLKMAVVDCINSGKYICKYWDVKEVPKVLL